jgi:simple sugar transport system ATP-binding protein
LRAGEVHALMGQNGAGKSTLIKVLCGAHRPDEGELRMRGAHVELTSPKDGLDRGIATVYQDLAMVPLMPVVRNFFLGSEPRIGRGPARRVDWRAAEAIAREQLRRIGIELRDTHQLVGTLSGGQRQCVAIARAMYFGASVLILDEPTAALGVKEAGLVLGHIHRIKREGVAVILITHNVSHAHVVGDEFVILSRGRVRARFAHGELTREQLQGHMAGDDEMDELGRAIRAAEPDATDLDFS